MRLLHGRRWVLQILCVSVLATFCVTVIVTPAWSIPYREQTESNRHLDEAASEVPNSSREYLEGILERPGIQQEVTEMGISPERMAARIQRADDDRIRSLAGKVKNLEMRANGNDQAAEGLAVLIVASVFLALVPFMAISWIIHEAAFDEEV